MLSALAAAQSLFGPTPSIQRLGLGLPGSLILFAPLAFLSASGTYQGAAYATGVPPDICAFYRYTGNSAPLSRPPVKQY